MVGASILQETLPLSPSGQEGRTTAIFLFDKAGIYFRKEYHFSGNSTILLKLKGCISHEFL